MPYSRLVVTSLLLSLLAGCGLQPRPSLVKVKEEPARGLTQNSFDQGYLRNLVEETRVAAEQHLQEYYDRDKTRLEERINHARTSGRYEWLGKRQLALIDLTYSANPMRVLRIVGLAQDKLITISCISPHGEAVDPRDEKSKCGDAVKRHFL